LIEGAIEVRPPALGDATAHLPWICPCAASLAALARSATAWLEVRNDPGAVLLLVRRSPQALAISSLSFFPSLVEEPAILEAALVQLEQPPCGFVDWNLASVQPIYGACRVIARLSQHIAEVTGRTAPDNAWVAGLLAPLGWLAVCATAPQLAATCLADADRRDQPVRTQQRHWGIDQAAIARRLAGRWRLPLWLAAVAGHLGLPLETALSLGADPDLFSIVQLAVGLLQEQQPLLGLAVGSAPVELAARLGLSDAVRESLQEQARVAQELIPALVCSTPFGVPLLRDLLSLALEHRRLRNAPLVRQLEADIDGLHRAFEDQRAGEAERLQARKLCALAEFAAGAGHEINNPLAVISGQAQYLLGHEAEPDRQRSLQTIIGQAHRIHQILLDLMQFARPTPPRKEAVNLPGLLREVTGSLSDLATERRVRLIFPDPEPTPSLSADPAHIRAALICLIRNAIEAAPADGWAGVRLENTTPHQVDVVVEDSGPGLPLPLREHLFDPFYSGRQAGRGRGLGLSTAWRLAKVHGGDLRFINLPNGPTRFVMSLPRPGECNGNGQHVNGDHVANGV
jgi:two-component system, NtrC family, sensor kinase